MSPDMYIYIYIYIHFLYTSPNKEPMSIHAIMISSSYHSSYQACLVARCVPRSSSRGLTPRGKEWLKVEVLGLRL